MTKNLNLELLIEVLMHFNLRHKEIIGINSTNKKRVYGITVYESGDIFIDPKASRDINEYFDTHLHELMHGYSHINNLGWSEEEVQRRTAYVIKNFCPKYAGKK